MTANIEQDATQAIHATSRLLEAMLEQATPAMLGDLERAMRGGGRVVVQIGLLPEPSICAVLIEREGRQTKLAELHVTQTLANPALL